MVPIRDSIDQECYLVTKHSWKGKYKRILAIGKTGISTYNPDKFDVTNRWPYSDVVAIAPNKSLQNVSTNVFVIDDHFVVEIRDGKQKSTTIILFRFIYGFQSNHEFSLTLRKDRKYDTIKLSSEFRNDILTSLFKYHKEFAEKIKTEVSIIMQKEQQQTV